MHQTIVLIPGFANSALAWQDQISCLRENYNVRVAVMDRFATRQEMADQLLEEIPGRFLLAGHSMGGWIAQAIAAKAPKRVTQLLLFNTWADLDPELTQMQQQICGALKMGQIREMMQLYLPMLIHPLRQQDPKLLGHLRTMIESFPLTTLIRQLEAMLGDSSSLHLHASIAAPTLIVHSSQDALFPKDHLTLCTGIRNSTVAIIEECGHSPLAEKPDIVTRLLCSFIDQKK